MLLAPTVRRTAVESEDPPNYGAKDRTYDERPEIRFLHEKCRKGEEDDRADECETGRSFVTLKAQLGHASGHAVLVFHAWVKFSLRLISTKALATAAEEVWVRGAVRRPSASKALSA